MLETARQFARERLAEGGKQQLLAQRHATALLALAERFDQARRHESEQVALALAQAEQDNVRAALQWALGDGHDILSGQRIVGLLAARFWAEILSAREGLGWMTRALELGDERTPVEVRARLHYALAVALPHLCQYDKQLVASQHATDLFRAAGDSVMEANARQVHAAALEMLGRTSEARAILEELLPFARRMKNDSRWSRGFLVVVLWRLANVRACQNDLTAARRLIAEAKQTEEAAGQVDFVATAREESWIEFLAGDPERALALFTEVVLPAIREEPGEWTAGALEDLVNYLIALTRFGEAAEVAHEMLALTAKFGDLADSTAAALQHLATIAAERPAKSDEDAQAKLRNAARILGYADARTQTLKARRRYYLQAAYERVNALLRNALGEDTLAQLMEAGAAMSEEDAVRLALCAN
jgi:hypothetical protein